MQSARLLVVVLAGCGVVVDDPGDTGINEGIYAIEANVIDTDCTGAQPIYTEWRLRRDGGGWLVTQLADGLTIAADGDERNVSFEHDSSFTNASDCLVDLTQTGDFEDGGPNSFEGVWQWELFFNCDASSCSLTYDVLGIED